VARHRGGIRKRVDDPRVGALLVDIGGVKRGPWLRRTDELDRVAKHRLELGAFAVEDPKPADKDDGFVHLALLTSSLDTDPTASLELA
jgi:hypothetical protein